MCTCMLQLGEVKFFALPSSNVGVRELYVQGQPLQRVLTGIPAAHELRALVHMLGRAHICASPRKRVDTCGW